MSPEQIFLGASAVPAIVGLIEVCKDAGLPSRFSPLAAIVLGALFSVATYFSQSMPLIAYVEAGVNVGLAAVGLYVIAPSSPKVQSVEKTAPPAS